MTAIEKKLVILTVVTSVIALIFSFLAIGLSIKERKHIKDEADDLRERLAEIESLCEKKATPQTEKQDVAMKDLFSFAGMESQLRKLKTEIEDLKKGGNVTPEQARQAEEKQVRQVRDVNKTFHKIWKDSIDQQIKSTGQFNDDERRQVVSAYGKLLEGVEDVQVRWVKGDLDWEAANTEVKQSSLQFFDTMSRDVGEEKARNAINIIFPSPEMKRYLFSNN